MSHSLLVLEDAVISQVLRNKTVVSEFPFLRNAASRVNPPKPRGCGTCGSRKNRNNAFDYNGIKSAINMMPLKSKARLKQLLDAERIRFYFVNGRGQRVKITF